VIGTPYSRVWGCYLSGMWIYRLGLTKVKQVCLTGEPLTGKEAFQLGLVNACVPFGKLELEVARVASKMAAIPVTQLAAMKLIVNQAYDNMGLGTTQLLGPLLDSFMRHTPEAIQFVRTAKTSVKAAVADRDGSPFRDYSQTLDKSRVPNPKHRFDYDRQDIPLAPKYIPSKL